MHFLTKSSQPGRPVARRALVSMEMIFPILEDHMHMSTHLYTPYSDTDFNICCSFHKTISVIWMHFRRPFNCKGSHVPQYRISYRNQGFHDPSSIERVLNLWVTCWVLSCDERLSAERLSARYPTGNTDEAGLQVWINKNTSSNLWVCPSSGLSRRVQRQKINTSNGKINSVRLHNIQMQQWGFTLPI